MSMTAAPRYACPILDASASGDLERIQQILLANPSAAAEGRDEHGNSAAHVAARHGRVLALALLARHEPGLLRARNNVRSAAVHAAAEAGEAEVLQWIFQQARDPSPGDRSSSKPCPGESPPASHF